MRAKKFRQYISDTFQFNIDKEKAIYLHLCKEKMNRRYRKLLSEETKFNSYAEWKRYIVSKYERYNKEGLIEFDRMLNWLLHNSRKMDNFVQCIWSAYISAGMAMILTKALSVQEINGGSFIILLTLCPFFMAVIFLMIYESYGSESITLLLLKDVKETVEELIKSK